MNFFTKLDGDNFINEYKFIICIWLCLDFLLKKFNLDIKHRIQNLLQLEKEKIKTIERERERSNWEEFQREKSECVSLLNKVIHSDPEVLEYFKFEFTGVKKAVFFVIDLKGGGIEID